MLNPLVASLGFAATLTGRPGQSALDLGTGAGVFALQLSRSHRHVVGVDVMPRSVAFANFNKALNERTNVDFVAADMYGHEAARGPFDTIVSNPPNLPCFDSRPGENYYCGGRRGDELTLALLEGLRDHLNPGGYCQFSSFFIDQDTGGGSRTVYPRLEPWTADDYDSVRFAYAVPFDDARCVPPVAEFGPALRVEYAFVALRRCWAPGAAKWSVTVPFRGQVPCDVDAVFRALDRHHHVPKALRSVGLEDTGVAR